MLGSCISEMSIRYEVMGQKFQNKLDHLEITSKNLAERVDQIQKDEPPAPEKEE
jgi:hypothetical protein|tara:strand:- start:57 stop:218 length:162 start_codon:yes stop_codon:yes gene_type:complete